MNRRAQQQGFSLTEVMVAVIVICIGLLGIAKMQALALSNSSTARMRSLAAIEAASLASVMHSNRNYWGSASPPAATTLVAGVVTSTDAALQAQVGAANCFNATCTPVMLAGFDLNRWVQSLQAALPNPSATIACPPAPNAPVACTIMVRWSEKAVAAASQEVGAINAMVVGSGLTLDYVLYVEP
ncbi:MAG: type IV pilus modification protein PilV [Gammaproteobacteria bacterium]|nr:type IV pilus modification protein PilV [Gammaproteobacteria bacterium]MBV9621877.1 type IV pilus modification protein PilV [Gammaproteobacteria bacterium]